MRLITRSMLVTLLTALIGGCAISGGDPVPPAYAPDRAMAPDRRSLDSPAGEEESDYQTLMGDMLATAGTALLLSSNAGLGLSLGKSFGIGLAATVLEARQDEKPDAASESTASMPAMTPEQMQAYLHASMQQASLQALARMGVSQAALEQGLQYKTFYEQANNTTLVASPEDGCIKMVDENGEGRCVLTLQPPSQTPVQPFEPQRPVFADTRAMPGYFGL